MPKITNMLVEALPPNTIVWDEGKGAITGFGARRQGGTAVSYIVKYRTADGRQRFPTIGRHGSPWTADLARKKAREILTEVAKGGDPSATRAEFRKALTVSELVDLYIEEAEKGRVLYRKRPKKASTLATDRGRLERHVKPFLGRMKISVLTKRDVERLRDAIAEGETAARVKTGPRGLARVTGGRGTSTRTLATFAAVLSWAVKKEMLSSNPAAGVETHAYERRERRVSPEEYRRLGAALRSMAPTAWPAAVSATRFLCVSGWRRGEVLSLRWTDIDLASRTAVLGDTKTGRSVRPLSWDAVEILKSVPGRNDGEFVFASTQGANKPIGGFNKFWASVAKHAQLSAEVTPHVLRHSYASIAADDLQFSELTVAMLLGHKRASTTARYVHHADATLLAAADRVAEAVLTRMGDARPSGAVVELRR